ncbi:MAG: hypothetical protein HYS18_02880 [Burkholderiales bacterium]|nr:hypothetical protein [Burkholderiales bacterium]
MLQVSALFGLKKSASSNDGQGLANLNALLNKDGIAILSAACCDSLASTKDEALKTNLKRAMEETGVNSNVTESTITETRKQLRELGANADEAQKQFKDNLASLFQSHGLAAFPMLFIGGRIAFYGGVPSTEMIQKKLSEAALPAQ